MPKTKSEGGGSVHTTLRIPRELHDRLAKAAGEQPLGDEIRRRLDATFAVGSIDPSLDPKARELAAAIVEAIAELARYFRPNPFFFKVLGLAIDKLLARYRPAGEPIPEPTDEMADIIFGDEPDIARTADFLVGYAVGRLKRR